MAYIGIDTGGTFTDFLLMKDDGSLHLHKVLSTPHAPELAILQGIKHLGISTKNLNVIHGSTVATNAILEGKGVKTAYITNKGFADVLSLHVKTIFRIKFPAKLLSIIIGELADEVLITGQHVIPEKVQKKGFVFTYPELSLALTELVGPPLK